MTEIGVVFYVTWGVLTVVVYSVVLALSIGEMNHKKDRRSRREFYVACALFIVAVASLFSVLLALTSTGTLFRLGFSALALGAFLGAGIIIALEYINRAVAR